MLQQPQEQASSSSGQQQHQQEQASSSSGQQQHQQERASSSSGQQQQYYSEIFAGLESDYHDYLGECAVLDNHSLLEKFQFYTERCITVAEKIFFG